MRITEAHLETLATTMLKGGTGGTLDLRTGELYDTREHPVAFAVGGLDESLKLTVREFWGEAWEARAAQLNELWDTNDDEQEIVVIGVWFDTVNREVVFDAVTVVEDYLGALALGRQREEDAIYDLVNNVEIRLA